MSAVHGDEFVLESQPTHDQKVRLGDFLSELTAVSRKYAMLIDAYGEEGKPAVIDIATGGRIVGLELTYFVDRNNHQVVRGYDFLLGSILDGAWPVDTEDGVQEQRFVNGSQELLERQLARMKDMEPRA